MLEVVHEVVSGKPATQHQIQFKYTVILGPVTRSAATVRWKQQNKQTLTFPATWKMYLFLILRQWSTRRVPRGNDCSLCIVPLTAVWQGVLWGNRMSCVFRVGEWGATRGKRGGGVYKGCGSDSCFSSSKDQELKGFSVNMILCFNRTVDGPSWKWLVCVLQSSTRQRGPSGSS